MSEELKACPFCGGRAYLHGEPGPLGTWKAMVECVKCNSQSVGVRVMEKMAAAESLAVQRWNSRDKNV